MIHASQAHKICTHRPEYSQESIDKATKDLAKSVKEKLKVDFNISNLNTYLNTKGLKMKTEALQKELAKKEQAELDLLPPGCKTELELMYLKKEYNIYDFSQDAAVNIHTDRGNQQEAAAIQLLGRFHNKNYKKNTTRISKKEFFLTGECDINYKKEIRDIKCRSFKVFRTKDAISSNSYWQLISYSLLYSAEELYIDNILMPHPEDMHPFIVKNMSDKAAESFYAMELSIATLKPEQRVKSFKYEGDLTSDQDFLIKRLEKSKKYYEDLTFEKCMGITLE